MAKILIIGGGVSGLATGIYAQMDGHQAIICERGSVAGGNLTGWQRGDYHIDNCIHWLTGTNPATETYKMWEELGALGGVEVYQGETLYTYSQNGHELSLCKDLKKLEEQMLSISPDDKKEIRSFFRAVETIQGMSGIAGENHDRKSSTAQMVTSLPYLYKYYSMTAGEVAERFKHPLIRGFISSFLGDQFGAIALIIVFAHFGGENGGIPVGGSCGMAKRMTDRFIALGGTLYLNKTAKKVNTRIGKAVSVSFDDGDEISADYIVLTADPAVIFKGLLDMPMPRKLQAEYKDRRKIRFSAIHCAFACDEKELPFRGDIIFDVPREYQGELHTKNLIIREFSHEPSFAPEGKNILQSVVFCDERMSRKFIKLRKNRPLYEKRKRKHAQLIQRLIEEKMPELQDKLKCIDVWTPATYKRFIDSEMGSFMSFALPSRCLPTRISNRIDGINNIILATQWQLLPGGLPIAAEGGKLAIQTIAKLEKKHAHKRQEKFERALSRA